MPGQEWIVEADGCEPSYLADLARLQSVFASIIRSLNLHPAGEPIWHQFPSTGGITGLCLLTESPLTCHTFPEYRSLCLNLFCCKPRPDWDFERYFKTEFSAAAVRVRLLKRPYQHAAHPADLPMASVFCE